MRNIHNISLPPQLSTFVQKEVHKGNYASASEFFRTLLRTYQLGKELKEDRKKFENGKGKILKSLSDLV